jgi:hypothetical protein
MRFPRSVTVPRAHRGLCGLRLLQVAIVVAVLSGGAPSVADDYVVEIAGTQGTPFAGTCLLVTGDAHANHDAIGQVPLTLQFSGDIISCAIMRRARAGDLRIVIRNAGGRMVAESSRVQPFGVAMAAGR